MRDRVEQKVPYNGTGYYVQGSQAVETLACAGFPPPYGGHFGGCERALGAQIDVPAASGRMIPGQDRATGVAACWGQ